MACGRLRRQREFKSKLFAGIAPLLFSLTLGDFGQGLVLKIRVAYVVIGNQYCFFWLAHFCHPSAFQVFAVSPASAASSAILASISSFLPLSLIRMTSRNCRSKRSSALAGTLATGIGGPIVFSGLSLPRRCRC